MGGCREQAPFKKLSSHLENCANHGSQLQPTDLLQSPGRCVKTGVMKRGRGAAGKGCWRKGQRDACADRYVPQSGSTTGRAGGWGSVGPRQHLKQSSWIQLRGIASGQCGADRFSFVGNSLLIQTCALAGHLRRRHAGKLRQGCGPMHSGSGGCQRNTCL